MSLYVFESQKALRAKEYECFVMKIGRLENLCRALQEERNELYKKIREAKMPDKDDQSQHTSDEEPEADSSVSRAVDAEEVTRVQNSVNNLAASFMIIHHPESTLDPRLVHLEPGSSQRSEASPLNKLEQAAVPGAPKSPPLLPVPEAEAERGNTVQPAPVASHTPAKSAGEPGGHGLATGLQVDQQSRKPKADASGLASELPEQVPLPRVEDNGSVYAETSDRAPLPRVETKCPAYEKASGQVLQASAKASLPRVEADDPSHTEASGQTSTQTLLLPGVEANDPAPPPTAKENVPVGMFGSAPRRQPPPAAAEELPPGASAGAQLPKVADTSLEGVD